MKIEKLIIRNFRCFGSNGTTVKFEERVTAFVGSNGSGKTAVFQALSRLFGINAGQRTVRRQDFHLSADQTELQSGSTMSIEVVLKFPELDGVEDDEAGHSVPEFFSHMAASAPGSDLKARMRLQATWVDDGTPDGSIEEDLRWITTLDEKFNWDDCTRVQAVERGSIQLVYVPATRDAESQVGALLKGRLWRAARWSEEFQESSSQFAQTVQEQFESEGPTQFVMERLSKRWAQVYDGDTDSTPVFRLIERRLTDLVRRVEFAFSPDEVGHEHKLAELSDGQRSLFHIALTAATLEVERDVFGYSAEASSFDHDKLSRTCLTLVAIEEPENSLSPFFLARIIAQVREIGSMPSAQVALSSHSPAILSRIEPEEVRYFRLNRNRRRSTIRRITLPHDDEEALQYIRLAVRAYPELYFARFVVLGEGDSEQVIIPRLAAARGLGLDPSFVPVVPLGGRYVSHFWRLLDDLGIPYATLLDLDLGRVHGGGKMIADVVANLRELGNDLSDNELVQQGRIDPDDTDAIEDNELMTEGKGHDWLDALRKERIFFSFPLDADFAMLRAFPAAYQHARPGGRGPRHNGKAVAVKKSVTLKTGGAPELYGDDFNNEFTWYPYLFLQRSKPETHIAALARIEDADLANEAPPELISLIDQIKDELGLEEIGE